MTNLAGEDHAIIFAKTRLRINMILWGIFSYFPTTKLTVNALQAGNDVDIMPPTTWNPQTNVHVSNEYSMLDWEGNIKERREWASQVVLEVVEDHIDASSSTILAVETKAICEEMMHHECEEKETYTDNLPWNGRPVIAGILTPMDKNIFS